MKQKLTKNERDRIKRLSTTASMYPQKPRRDLGLFLRPKLNDCEFRFNQLEAYAFVRIDAGTFMLMSEYKQGQETFKVTVYFSKPQILTIAEGVSDVCPELSLFLLDIYKQPFALETADFMEIDLPYRASIWITVSTRLFLVKEHEYIAAGNEFLPFIATQIHECETEDWLA